MALKISLNIHAPLHFKTRNQMYQMHLTVADIICCTSIIWPQRLL